MAMTYTESAALMSDQTFRGRVKVACLTYADYISGEPPNTPAHSTRLKWAQSVYQSPDNAAGQIQPGVVMDSAVQQAGGAAVSDQALQGAVETVVNKML